MKNKNFLFPVLMAFAVSFTACEAISDESCDGLDLAEDDLTCPSDVDAVATFCSDGVSNSYYTYGGGKYECTGIEASTCDNAIRTISNKLIGEGCSSAKKSSSIIEVKLSSMAENLLIKVKSESLCK